MAFPAPTTLIEAAPPVGVVRLVRLRLDELAIGDEATVGAPTEVDATVLRLLEMGLTAGARVRVARRAPWGGPLEVHVRGTRVCLRGVDAARFPVELVSRAGAP